MSETSADNIWIRTYHPADPDAVQLVCLPHAGGSASFYFPVSRALAPRIAVLAVQYPGRQDRRADPRIEDIGELADEITAAVRPRLRGPVALFGHSMGAVLAFEVTRRLEKHGVPVSEVFVSGRRAPSTTRDENVHRRDDHGIVAEMRELSGTDARILADEELLRMAMPAIRSDYTAIERYRAEPGAVVDAPITALTGDADPRSSLAEVTAWQAHTTGRFTLHTFAGGHFFLANHQNAINDLVADRLTGADAAGAPPRMAR
ncbi:surfactin synthase thioesterase subunit [Actinoplanes octamycinicus]|uniref:Surfactin synthase thioesterase subunit n=1 Tax=Actinoplanes octamycinicus TaxID=135948 RepID=A0A7W7GY59_9ACTN|nr:alpha/beta fold hydrolase [Actinoplanes octamycinicus]MBB4740382.1 surfactin synthase thioesterase subunit [Actinoplanes octamycinicus]GIE59643.1 thioesterase [Actinoplanes octamycinicus]